MATDELATVVVSTAAPQRLSPWLKAARLGWVFAFLASLSIVLAAFVALFGGTLRDPGGWLSIGLSLTATLVSLTLACLLFWRKANDPMALFLSFFLLFWGVGSSIEVTLGEQISNVLFYVLFPVLLLIFPTGRFAPRWTRFLPLLMLVFLALPMIFSLDQSPELRALRDLLNAGPNNLLLVALGVQVYRYLKLYTPPQRQQIKWVVYGIALWFGINILIIVPSSYLNSLPATAPRPWWEPLELLAYLLTLNILPISFALAIMRSRLWDIDLIINRTLVYGLLTAILAGLYAALISLLQRLSQALTGATSDAAVVLTTLILTASFTPIKNALQSAVDKRFKGGPGDVERLKALGHEVEQRIYPLDVAAVGRRLLDIATAAFNTGGALYLQGTEGKRPAISHSTDGWKDSQTQVTVPLQAADGEIGKLLLGNRLAGRAYTKKDIQLLCKTVTQIAVAIQQQYDDTVLAGQAPVDQNLG
jgi:hypothetical protein